MSALGFVPTKNSGAGWIEKEDGQNDYLIAQLKSTDAMSISIHQKDINILEYNAGVTHKVPCFVIQFLNTGDVFIMARPNDLEQVTKYITTGHCELPKDEFIGNVGSTKHKPKLEPVRSSSEAREDFWKTKEKEQEQWKKRLKQKR